MNENRVQLPDEEFGVQKWSLFFLFFFFRLGAKTGNCDKKIALISYQHCGVYFGKFLNNSDMVSM